MLFSSVTFLFYFLPLVVLGYLLAPTIPIKNLFLLAASLFFYAWGEPWFILIMVVSIAMNHIGGLKIGTATGMRRRIALAVTVVGNLLILAIFKYADFIVQNVNLLLPSAWPIPVPGIPLPLGISFFTFQGISYLMDVYRRHVPVERNPIYLGTYIAMFPQLVAGPIVRFEAVAKQLRVRRTTRGRASVGTRIFVIGLAQKVLVANEVALLADAGFSAAHPSMVEAWLGLVAYTLQIYFDFAGYSNMAIGLGIIFGFTFPRNFRLPYRSRSVTEFWRRWHISLSSWFRDYLYVPLGGNRYSPMRTYFNLATVFLLCGLWHGASWTFVVWGAHHGGLLILERAWLAGRLRAASVWLSRGYTLLAVMAGWVWFRADDLPHALSYFRALIGADGLFGMSAGTHLALYPTTVLALIVGAVLALRSARARWLPPGLTPLSYRPHIIVVSTADTIAIFTMFALSAMAVGAGSYNPFLYFRF